MDEIKLSTSLINSILQYLGNRPYIEVMGLVQAIHKEATAQGAVPVAQEAISVDQESQATAEQSA